MVLELCTRTTTLVSFYVCVFCTLYVRVRGRSTVTAPQKRVSLSEKRVRERAVESRKGYCPDKTTERANKNYIHTDRLLPKIDAIHILARQKIK